MARPREFVALMALSMSLVALAIDAMLPALSQIATDLNVARENDRQLVITVLFIGLALGQLFYGPISDSTGRKSPIYFGFGLFIVGSIICVMAETFNWLLIGRFLQGLGAAGPRILTVAIVRDGFAGREMARVMSLVMMVFILVPAVAPALGQAILMFADWRAIFYALMILAMMTVVWFHLRQPETLHPEDRKEFSLGNILRASLEICRTRSSAVYALAAGMIFGAFIGFLNSSQQILQELYGLGVQFPLYFAVLALTIGVSSFVNSRVVVKLGMRLMSKTSLWTLTIISAGFFVYCLRGQPSLATMMIYLMAAFFCVGILFGNLNSLAMEPLGHIAGLASSLIGSVTTFLSLIIGYWIGILYNHTLLPVVGGFCALGAVSLLLVYLAGDSERAPALGK